MIGRLFLMIALLAVALPAPAQEALLFNTEGYRIAHYRGPIATPPDGVARITPEEASRLRPDHDALFIDVLPAEGGHRDAHGRWHLALPHDTIRGAHWFPEAGRGELDPAIAAAFTRGIARLSGGGRDRTILVFCLSDCWMSWNAARRLRALGYRDVRWLAEGTDGWRAIGMPLERAVPVGGMSP